MNQILDRSGPKKSRIQRDPKDTIKIIKVYAILMIIFGIMLVFKGCYGFYENKKTIEPQVFSSKMNAPEIVLEANQDILNISARYSQPLETITYQWYRGIATAEEIEEYERNGGNPSEPVDEADDELQEEVEEIYAIGKLVEEKLTGEKEGYITNIGIPRGDTTIVVNAVARDGTTSRFIQNYHTDIGVDKIAPVLDVQLKNTTLLITARDETEMLKLIYSVNGVAGPEVTERQEKGVIKTEIKLDSENEDNYVKISAVDKANNTSEPYENNFTFYIGVPKIEWVAEPDYSKVYAVLSYYKGISKVEYTFNGESDVIEFENPEDVTDHELEFNCRQGHNEIYVKVYSKDERVYAEDTGECEY